MIDSLCSLNIRLPTAYGLLVAEDDRTFRQHVPLPVFIFSLVLTTLPMILPVDWSGALVLWLVMGISGVVLYRSPVQVSVSPWWIGVAWIITTMSIVVLLRYQPSPPPLPRELQWADTLHIAEFFRHKLGAPCRVKITATNDNKNFRNILAHIVRNGSDCSVVDDSADSQTAKVDVDKPSSPVPRGIVVHGPKDQAEDLAHRLSGLGLKAAWGSGAFPDVDVTMDIGTGSPWEHP